MPNNVAVGVAYKDPQLDGAIIGESGGTVGFYGTTPVVRRTFVASLHNSTAIAASASFGASQLAVVQEIQNTLRALGIWATA